MRIRSLVALVMVGVMAMGMVAGCAGTNANPYSVIDGIVKGDDVVVRDATLAVPLGVLSVKDATTLYTADETFVVLGLPLLEATAQSSAAPVLDPAAVTWAEYLVDKNTLVADLTLLHTVITNGVSAQIKAARAALNADADRSRTVTPPKR